MEILPFSASQETFVNIHRTVHEKKVNRMQCKFEKLKARGWAGTRGGAACASPGFHPRTKANTKPNQTEKAVMEVNFISKKDPQHKYGYQEVRNGPRRGAGGSNWEHSQDE
jgi:hypothetical protein